MTRSGEPTRVCLITQRWAPEFSGAALRFRQYLSGLRQRGIEVDVLCSTSPDAEVTKSLSRWERLEFGGIFHGDIVEGTAVHRVKLPDGQGLRRNMLFRGAVTKHLGMTRTAVAHYLTLEPLRTYRGRGLLGTGARGVFTGTQMWAFSGNPVKRVLQRHWIRVPIQGLDHVVVSSTVMRDFYRSLGVRVPISVIPNGVNLERFRVDDPEGERQSARESLGISMTANVVVFVGSIIRRKGVDLLIEAFARVAAADPLAELVLVGPRDDGETEEARAFSAQIDKLVTGSCASDRIHFAEYVPNVDDYLRAADCFVLPSRREGMGNVVLEAMAMGIPTVLTPYLGLPREFGRPGRQYVLSGLDPVSLAANIESLLTDRIRRRAVGEEGRRWVAEHMSMTTAIDAYANIYRDLAACGTVRTQNRALSWIE